MQLWLLCRMQPSRVSWMTRPELQGGVCQAPGLKEETIPLILSIGSSCLQPSRQHKDQPIRCVFVLLQLRQGLCQRPLSSLVLVHQSAVLCVHEMNHGTCAVPFAV